MSIGRIRWHGLLVSVRDEEEARAARAGGAAIVDVKDPIRGALGRADAALAARIGAALDGRVPWTIAAGELADGVDTIARHVAAIGALLEPHRPRPAAVKAGPAGLALAPWREAFARFVAALPEGTAAVAVAYADWERAAAPAPGEIVAAAAESGATALLVDTFDKAAAGLFACTPESAVARWVRLARARNLPVALAGRLTAAEVARALKLGADVVGVRSAACAGGRLGRVDRARVASLVDCGFRRPVPAVAGPGESVP